ncbi:unnamed protein product [Trifolium pratense]|uniref:Uncharacterized protein n=1 Tax=Trifolium pratense TaxID=57577 RepID=A0ACB0JA65_TRIPR|nr:unnamed protein product [Trifolium pratense]
MKIILYLLDTERGRNMTQIINFIYVVIILIFVFLITMNVDGYVFFKCFQEYDCPKYMCPPPIIASCVNRRICACIKPYFEDWQWV